MARTHGVSYTWGRESRDQYNESGAGSQLTPRATANVNPFDAKGELLPLLNAEPPFTPAGQEDKGIQAYNFRICVTNNDTIRVPFEKPAGYDPQYWELLRRFWLAWPNSTVRMRFPPFPPLQLLSTSFSSLSLFFREILVWGPLLHRCASCGLDKSVGAQKSFALVRN